MPQASMIFNWPRLLTSDTSQPSISSDEARRRRCEARNRTTHERETFVGDAGAAAKTCVRHRLERAFFTCEVGHDTPFLPLLPLPLSIHSTAPHTTPQRVSSPHSSTLDSNTE